MSNILCQGRVVGSFFMVAGGDWVKMSATMAGRQGKIKKTPTKKP